MQLIYYWKEFELNLKNKRVGWLGVSRPSTVFKNFNDSISELSDSWIIAFRKMEGKFFPVAVLKATKKPIVEVVNDQGYVDFVYYDPWKSFRLNRPTDPDGLRKFYELGEEIASHYSDNCTFNGLTGLHLISSNIMLELISKARKFKGNDLEIYAGTRLVETERSTELTLADLGNADGTPGKGNAPDKTLHQPMSETVAPRIDDNQLNDQEDLRNVSDQVHLDYANKPGEDVDVIVKRRLGQGPFRKLLQKIYGTSCWLSGLTDSRLLIASHIVPWSSSDSSQKTDPENGLLLSVSWDALFDKGYVSFSDDGILLCSDWLNEDIIKCLGVSRKSTLSAHFMTVRRRENLAWHRKQHGFKV